MIKQIKRQLPIIVLKEFCVEFEFKGQENKSTTTDQFQKKNKNIIANNEKISIENLEYKNS